MRILATATLITLLTAPVFAEDLQGDVEAGEEQFNRQCISCHVVRDTDGNTLAGRNGRAGPNLYNVAGAPVAAQDGFRYGDSIEDAAEAGLTWTEENFVDYVQDPTKWLRAELDNKRARSKMAYRVRNADQAFDIYAYLASLAPAAE